MNHPVPDKEKTSPSNPKGATREEAQFAELREQLRATLQPLAEPELRRDLWPDMLRRMEQKPVRLPWFDWALLATASAAMAFFPALIPALLYHL